MRSHWGSLHRNEKTSDIVPRDNSHSEYDAGEDDINNVNREFVVNHRGTILPLGKRGDYILAYFVILFIKKRALPL